MTTDLNGTVWQSATDPYRRVAVTHTDPSYAHVVGVITGRRSRVLLDGKGGLRGYRRVEAGR